MKKYTSLARPGSAASREWEVLAMLEEEPLAFYDICARTTMPKQRVAWLLGKLIARGFVVPVREGRLLRFERVPGSLIEYILDHER